MDALVCGSMAYDNIMLFEDRFKNHILPDQVHILNVAFLVPKMRKEFGGCAGNICYNLRLLGIDGVPMSTVGEDFTHYASWLDSCGVKRKYLKNVPGSFTAQAYITTDLDDNQITAFHPGAMNFSHQQAVTDVMEPIKLGIVSPDGKKGMMEHADQFRQAGIPFIFDPGQGLPMFTGPELLDFINHATWITLNDYESKILCERTGLTIEEVAARVDALIITRGAQGSVIITMGGWLEIPTARPSIIYDPTGCGDAYRAGLIYGILNDLDWENTGRVASLMGALKVSHHGTQNHKLAPGELDERFFDSFGYRL